MEYRSTASFLGLPLGHIATGGVIGGRYRRGVATAWLAVGDIAVGVFFACGGIALGGAALGVLPIVGVASARTVITAPSPDSLPLASIPHAPFNWPDALLLIVIAAVLLVVALSVQARRRE